MRATMFKAIALGITLAAVTIPATAGIIMQLDIRIPDPLDRWIFSTNALISALVLALIGSLIQICGLKREIAETWAEAQGEKMDMLQELEEILEAEAKPQPTPPTFEPAPAWLEEVLDLHPEMRQGS